ncbi:MAG: hypothetical protein ABR534_15270 [Desulfotignum sp.]
MKQDKTYHAGLDIGSTTAKLVLVDATDQLIFSRYQRHYARILDAVPDTGGIAFDTLQVLTQWAYPNRLYHAASWVARQPDHIQMIQLNSFGCGPDAVAMEENRQILEAGAKNHTLIKVDDIAATGSVRLRIRSMVESLVRRTHKNSRKPMVRKTTPGFEKKDRTKKINQRFERFRFYTPFHDIRKVADKAGRILSLVNQFGEGWLIPGEIACLAEDGINHVISVQPFGCIANHIVSKGVEKRIKTLYPDMNLLYLDFDAGTSEVNIRNRLYFMVEAVKESNFFDPDNGKRIAVSIKFHAIPRKTGSNRSMDIM